MAISRAQLAKELEPGLNALFGLEYDENQEEYKELSERLSLERDQYKVKADEFDNFQKDARSNLLDGLSDEQKVIAEELSISKLQKFVDLNKARPVATQESTSTKMALEKDAWKDMDQKNYQYLNYRNL